MKMSCVGGRIGVSVLKHRQSLSSQEDDMTPRKYKLPRTDFSKAKPFKIDGVYCKLIQLTKGMYAIVWASDYEWLTQWKWHARWYAQARTYYASRNEYPNGKRPAITVQMHREILGLPRGDSRDGDHREPGNTLDNRRSNLRVASSSQNAQNRIVTCRNTSGYKGVSFYKRYEKWMAFINIARKRIFLGYFKTFEAARDARLRAEPYVHGDFARNNR